MVFQDGAELRVGHVGVNLGGLDGAMAEEPLDVADVDVLLEEERGEGVAEHVRRYVCGGGGAVGVLGDEGADRLLGQALVEAVDEERARGARGFARLDALPGVSPREVIRQSIERAFVLHLDDALPGALSEDEERLCRLVEVPVIEAAQLGDPQAGCEQHFHDGAIAGKAERSVPSLGVIRRTAFGGARNSIRLAGIQLAEDAVEVGKRNRARQALRFAYADFEAMERVGRHQALRLAIGVEGAERGDLSLCAARCEVRVQVAEVGG